MKIVAIILTFNEQQHLERCINSIKGIVTDIVVADCFSTDETLNIARAHGARVIQNRWINHATQFNWALNRLDLDTDWVLRIDADEYITEQLSRELETCLKNVDPMIDGVFINRRMTFLGRPIRHGGVFPIQVLRLFRFGKGKCESRWMDEHIKVAGETLSLKGELIDDNLNSLTWWTEKHNNYASREVVDLLNLEYGFMPHETVADLSSREQAGIKRWIKERVYARLPSGVRALVYFIYRYVIRLGFLDGKEGAAFHVLQGFWYRFLVDMKLYEVKKHMRERSVDAPTAIKEVLGIDI